MTSPLRALPVTVRPLAGESAVGLIMRLANENGLSYPWLFERIACGRHNPDNWGDEQWQRLADTALIDVADLNGMRCRPVDDRRMRNAVTFLGMAVRRTYLAFDRMRLCPHCVAQGGVMREAWKLAHWTACLEHGTYLVDACDCGRPLHIIRRGTWPDECVCGKPFGEIAARPASEHALAATRWLVQLFGPRLTATAQRLWLDDDRLGPPFDGLARTIAPDVSPIDADDLDLPLIELPLPETRPMHVIDALGILELIGIAATTPKGQDEARASRTVHTVGRGNRVEPLATSISHVEAAMRVIRRWPGGWHDILEDIAGRNANAGDDTPADLFATRIGRLVLDPYLGVDGYPVTVLSDETRTWLANRGYSLRTRPVARFSTVARRVADILPIGEAARLLRGRIGPGVRRSYHRAVREMDQTDTSDMTDEQVAEALLDRVRQLVEVIGDHVSLCVVAETLCSRDRRTGGGVWSDPRLLQPLRIEHTADGRSKGDVYARADLERMQAKLSDAARLVRPDDIPKAFERYGDVTQETVSTYYTASDLIVHILSGEVPSVTTVPSPTLADLWIPRHAVERLAITARVRALLAADRFATSSTVRDVAEKLWGARHRELTRRLPKLRDARIVRFEETLDEKNDKVRYRTAIADCLREAETMFGTTGIEGVDALLKQIGKPSYRDAA